jgi:hypothetical protein
LDRAGRSRFIRRRAGMPRINFQHRQETPLSSCRKHCTKIRTGNEDLCSRGTPSLERAGNHSPPTTEFYCVLHFYINIRLNFTALLRELCSVFDFLDRLCDRVVRVPGYRSGGPGLDSQALQGKKVVGLERGPLSPVSTTDCLRGLAVRVPGYRSEGPEFDSRALQ